MAWARSQWRSHSAPTQTLTFTKHTWHEHVHNSVTIPPPKPWLSRSIHGVSTFTIDVHILPPPKPWLSRSIHGVSTFTMTWAFTPHLNPDFHDAYMAWARSQWRQHLPHPNPDFHEAYMAWARSQWREHSRKNAIKLIRYQLPVAMENGHF